MVAFLPGVGAAFAIFAAQLPKAQDKKSTSKSDEIDDANLADSVASEIHQTRKAETKYIRKLNWRLKWIYSQRDLHKEKVWDLGNAHAGDRLHTIELEQKPDIVRDLIDMPGFETSRILQRYIEGGRSDDNYILKHQVDRKFSHWEEELQEAAPFIHAEGTDDQTLFEATAKYLGLALYGLLPKTTNDVYIRAAYDKGAKLYSIHPQDPNIAAMFAKAAVLAERYKQAIEVFNNNPSNRSTTFGHYFWIMECYTNLGQLGSVNEIVKTMKDAETFIPKKFKRHIDFWDQDAPRLFG